MLLLYLLLSGLFKMDADCKNNKTSLELLIIIYIRYCV